MEENETTTIRIAVKTKSKFDKLGSYGMSADEVLNSLIDFYTRYKDVVNK